MGCALRRRGRGGRCPHRHTVRGPRQYTRRGGGDQRGRVGRSALTPFGGALPRSARHPQPTGRGAVRRSAPGDRGPGPQDLTYPSAGSAPRAARCPGRCVGASRAVRGRACREGRRRGPRRARRGAAHVGACPPGRAGSLRGRTTPSRRRAPRQLLRARGFGWRRRPSRGRRRGWRAGPGPAARRVTGRSRPRSRGRIRRCPRS